MTAYVVSDCEHGRVFGCRVSVSSCTESYLLCSQPGAMEQPGTYCIPPHQLAGMTSILTPAFKRQWSDPLQVGSTGPLTHEHQTPSSPHLAGVSTSTPAGGKVNIEHTGLPSFSAQGVRGYRTTAPAGRATLGGAYGHSSTLAPNERLRFVTDREVPPMPRETARLIQLTERVEIIRDAVERDFWSDGGMAFEHAYSAEQALKSYRNRERDARCPMCGGLLGEVRLRWYGADYCGEECLRQGRMAQRTVVRS